MPALIPALKNISVANKLYLLLALTLVGMIVLSAQFLSDYRTALIDDRKAQTKSLVDVAVSTAKYYVEQEKAGLARADAQHAAINAIKTMRYDGNNYFWINDMHPNMVMHPMKPELDGTDISKNADPEGKTLFVEMVERVKADGSGFVSYMWPKPGAALPQPKISYVAGVPEWGWVIGSGIYVDDVNSAFYHEMLITLLSVFAIYIFFVLISSRVAADIKRPVVRMAALIDRLAKGKPADVIPEPRGDEIGVIAQAVTNLDETLKQARVAEAERRAAQHLAAEQADAMRVMIAAFDKTSRDFLARVTGSVEGLQTTAAMLSGIATQGSTQSSQLSEATQDVVESVQTAASATEEMSASVQEISAQIQKSNHVIGTAVDKALAADKLANDLSDASGRVTHVLELISGISNQINLLSLNATIEAARAGDAGKGFAVVAGEVKNLAHQTDESVQEINKIVEFIQTVSTEITRALADIRGAIDEVNHASSSIAAAIEEQSATTTEIAKSMQFVSRGAGALMQSVELVAESASLTGNASDDMQEATSQLNDDTRYLMGEVKSFLDGVAQRG